MLSDMCTYGYYSITYSTQTGNYQQFEEKRKTEVERRWKMKLVSKEKQNKEMYVYERE